MEYRKLGKAGTRVSAVSLGGWLTFGASLSEKQSHRILDVAVEHGINFIDLADVYAHGKAERIVGNYLKGKDRSRFVISSKVFWPMSSDVNDRGLSRKHVYESIHRSLKRLGTDYLDIYFCHRYDTDTPLEETIRIMDDLVHQGKIIYWGTSVWTAAQIEKAVGLSNRFMAYPPQVEQPRYNMLDRHIEREVLPTCESHGIGLTVWSPLAGGILTGKYNEGIPPGSRAATSDWLKEELTEENLQKVRELTRLARDLGMTMAELALAWVLRLPQISSAITGATREEHILSNVRAVEARERLTPEVLERIERILQNKPEPPNMLTGD